MTAAGATVAALWAAVAALVWAAMTTDSEWRASDDGRVRAAGDSLLLATPFVLLPAAFVLGLESVTPQTTLRGRTLYPWANELLALVFVGVGVYLAYVSRRRGFLSGEGASTSTERQETVWAILGGGMAVAALVAGFL